MFRISVKRKKRLLIWCSLMSDIVIAAEGLGKKYLIGHECEREQYTALRDVIGRTIKGFARSARDMVRGRQLILGDEVEEFWALRDVNFEIKRGEVVGILGRNGAGKSTLLKILSRITEPTVGRVEIRGRVASLLEVGTGFHPELTGRENIFLNGAILGMTRSEIRRKFDEIVDFAGVEKFLDTPVKRYSSGMYVRLAFAVAAHLEPEILVVDEVLAVGDAEFQKKCLGKMQDVASEGRTVLFVSHNMAAIKGFCENSLWLDAAKIRKFGLSSHVIADYVDSSSKLPKESEGALVMGEKLTLRKVIVRNSSDIVTSSLKPFESFLVEVHYSTEECISKPYFWIDVKGQYGHLFTAAMVFDGLRPASIHGDGLIKCRFKNVGLLPQSYTISVRVRAANGTDILVPAVLDAACFDVIGSAEDYGMSSEIANSFLDHDSPLLVPYEWLYEDDVVREPSWQK